MWIQLRFLQVTLPITLALIASSISFLVLTQTLTGTKVGLGYWHTSGAQILDVHNQPVRIAGISWFGFETPEFVVHGLGIRNYKSMLDQIRSLHYNTLRLPYSNQLFAPTSQPHGINYHKNPDLVGLSGLQLLDKIIDYASQIGLRIILDRHRLGADAQSPLWYTPAYPESRWIADWQMLATHYKGNSMVIGADLHNEPNNLACWGCGDPTKDWQLAATRAGNAILAINPHWLIFVQGVECYRADATQSPDCYWWGGNLKGVRTAPINFDVPHQLVYSVHDYAPSISQYPQRWFQGENFSANLPHFWDTHWGYIYKENIAPIWVGEFGSRLQTEADQKWFMSLINYLGDGVNGIHWTIWCWNPDSGDTGGILNDDWATVNQAKQNYLTPIQFRLEK